VVNPLQGTEITALFDPDGTLSGSGGCNEYTAPYESDSDSLTTGPAARTERACAEPEGIMEQEDYVLGLLQSAATYEILADSLAISNSDGIRMLLFVVAQGGD
jgi:heat shock protein HslJ